VRVGIKAKLALLIKLQRVQEQIMKNTVRIATGVLMLSSALYGCAAAGHGYEGYAYGSSYYRPAYRPVVVVQPSPYYTPPVYVAPPAVYIQPSVRYGYARPWYQHERDERAWHHHHRD
jgi:hypothetical protein